MKRLKLVTSRDHCGTRLDDVLAEWLPRALGRPVSKSKTRKLLIAGAVYLNGRQVRSAGRPLSAGVTIEANVDLAKLFEDSTSRDKRFELTADRILFEDEGLIVVDKPAGLPFHATVDVARDNLVAAVKRFLSHRDGLANPYLGIHQRLDRDTSGVVLFTKSQRANAAVAEIFSKRQAVKIYHALTVPHPRKKEWMIRNRLGKVSTTSKRAQYGAVKSEGDPAETSFRVIEEYPHGTWIEAIPKTGRTHQIRVHLAEFGLPILGDDLYGDVHELAPRLMLHASELRFPHPITKREVVVKSPAPPDFACLIPLLGKGGARGGSINIRIDR